MNSGFQLGHSPWLDLQPGLYSPSIFTKSKCKLFLRIKSKSGSLNSPLDLPVLIASSAWCTVSMAADHTLTFRMWAQEDTHHKFLFSCCQQHALIIWAYGIMSFKEHSLGSPMGDFDRTFETVVTKVLKSCIHSLSMIYIFPISHRFKMAFNRRENKKNMAHSAKVRY